MGVVLNTRNAVMGWVFLQVGKRVAKKKAKSIVPAVEDGRPNKPAIATAGVVAVGGTLLFWRKLRVRRRGDEVEVSLEVPPEVPAE
jgi:hypothetical protein